jgi:hypothetical protein
VEGSIQPCVKARTAGVAGVKDQGELSKGYPVNPGDLPISSEDWASVLPTPNRTWSRGYEETPDGSEQLLTEVNGVQAQAEVVGMDSGEVLRTHSTDEGRKAQGSQTEAATISTGGKGETAGRIEQAIPERDSEPGHSGKRSMARLTELAKEDPARRFSSIAHWLTQEALYEAFRRLRKNAAEGVDEVTYRDYERQASKNISRLWESLRNKTYRAQPLRRIYIPKEDGKERPISIPALEDKIVQKACVQLLNAIFGAPGKAWCFQRV